MYCKECGQKLKLNYKYCPKCGYMLDEDYYETNTIELSTINNSQVRVTIFEAISTLSDAKFQIFNHEIQAELENGEKVPFFYLLIKKTIGGSKRVLAEFRTYNTIRLIIYKFDSIGKKVEKNSLFMFIISIDYHSKESCIFEVYNENDNEGRVIEYDSSNKRRGINLIIELNEKSMIKSIFGILRIGNNDDIKITKEQRSSIEEIFKDSDSFSKTRLCNVLEFDMSKTNLLLSFLQNNGALYPVYDDELSSVSKTIFTWDFARLRECLELITLQSSESFEKSKLDNDVEKSTYIFAKKALFTKYNEIYHIEVDADFDNVIHMYEKFVSTKLDRYSEKYLYEISVVSYLLENNANALKYAKIAAEKGFSPAMNFYAYLALTDQFHEYLNNGLDLRKMYFAKAENSGSHDARTHLANLMNLDEDEDRKSVV